MWSPSRLFSLDRLFAPERLRRQRRWRTVVITIVAVVSLVMGVTKGDDEQIALGVLCLVGGIPLIRFWYRWQTRAGEQLARKRSGGSQQVR